MVFSTKTWMFIIEISSLIVLFADDVLSDACRSLEYYTYHQYVYCEKGCCGYKTEPSCCATSFETIVGAIFGVLIFLGIIGVSIVCCCSRRSQKCALTNTEPVGVIHITSEPSVVYHVNAEDRGPAVVIKPPPYTRDPPPSYTPNPTD